jgi:hypothetical protein
MAIEKNKPDLYTVLKRRKRSVADFLVETEINDLPELSALVRSLENVYSISNQFMREANAHILSSLSKQKEIDKATKEADANAGKEAEAKKHLNGKSAHKEANEKGEAVAAVEKPNPTRKPPRKRKASTKKSSVTSADKNPDTKKDPEEE